MSIRVFITYSHDSEAHKQMVLELANRLRVDGVDARIDRYETAPPLGWPRWMAAQVEDADYVVCICTETWSRRFEGKEEAGRGNGATWEGMLATQLLYDAGTLNHKLIPVVPDGIDDLVPIALRPFTRHRLPSGYDQFYWHITGQAAIPRPVIGSMRARPAAATVSTVAPEDVRSGGLPAAPPTVPTTLQSTDLPQDSKRLRSLQNFALLWALVDQLDGGGWGRSLAAWMHRTWSDVEGIRVNASMQTEGGIESACLMVHILASAGVPRGRWSDLALSFLTARRDKESGLYGTIAELREGSLRVLGHPRHTAWSAIAWLSLNELYGGNYSREVNDALVALFSEPAQTAVTKDLNPAVLHTLQCFLAGEVAEPSAFRLYSPTEDARLAAEWWSRTYSGVQLRRATVSSTDTEERLDPLRPSRSAPFPDGPQRTGRLVYPYGGFARMQTYTHLLSCFFASKATPKQLAHRLRSGLMSIIDWYLEDAANGDLENPMQQPQLVDLRYPLRGVRPFPTATHPDAACTALLLSVLSRADTLRALDLDESDKVPSVRRMLAWDLIHCFDRFLLAPHYFQYSAATAFASVLLADVRVADGRHDDEPSTRFANILKVADPSVRIPGAMASAVARLVFYCDGPNALPAQVFSDSVTAHLLNQYESDSAADDRNLTAQAYNHCADQFAHMVDGLLNANPDERRTTIENLLSRLRSTFGQSSEFRVVDVGCGPGRHTADMDRMGVRAHGIDISEEAIKVARSTFPEIRTRFHVGDITVDATWEALSDATPAHGIYAVASFHHIPTAALDGVLARLHGALVPGGWVLISLQIGRLRGYDPDGRFIESYSKGELVMRLTKCGFVNASSLGLFVLPMGKSTFQRQMTFTFEQVVAQRRQG